MRKLGFALTSLLVALGGPAHAATLALSVDQSVYQVGDTITLTVTGDAQGAFAPAIHARIEFSNPSILDLAGADTSTGFPCDPTGCVVFDQILPPTTLPFVATVSILAVAPGTSLAYWNPLDFFGLSNAPGTTITIVPEPATALLLGAGLAALAARRHYTP